MRCVAHRALVVATSCDQALRNHLQEDAARVHGHAVLVSPIDSAKFPAAAAVVEVLKEAVPGATPCVGLNGIAAILLGEPNRLQVPLAAVRRLHVSACDQSLGGLQRAKAQRGAVRRVERDLFAIGDTSSTESKGRSLLRVPSLGRGRSLHLLNIRSGIQSSTEKWPMLFGRLPDLHEVGTSARVWVPRSPSPDRGRPESGMEGSRSCGLLPDCRQHTRNPVTRSAARAIQPSAKGGDFRSRARYLSSRWKIASCKNRPESHELSMSYSISTLLTRNLHDVFGENDPERRRAAIDELYTEDVVFYDPSKGVYRGRDEIDRIAGAIKATHPDFSYQLIAEPEEVGDGGRVAVGIGPPWRCASLRRNGFHHRPGRPDCRHLSFFRQAALRWALSCATVTPPDPFELPSHLLVCRCSVHVNLRVSQIAPV